MGWMHGGLTGVIIDGGTSAIAGVRLSRLGRDWAQAKVPASSVTNSAKCLCNFCIIHYSGTALRREQLLYLTDACCCRLLRSKGWLLSAMDRRSSDKPHIGATLTNQG